MTVDPTLWVLENLTDGTEVYVGTDSQQLSKWTKFVSVIVLREPGSGGKVIYAEWKLRKINNLRERLLRETIESLETAVELVSIVNPAGESILDGHKLEIHIDANLDESFASSKHAAELAGLVEGQGFSVALKPDSWASSSVADKVVKLF